MMTVEYDQVLVEQATFLAVRQSADLEREFHRVIDPLYEMTDRKCGSADEESRQRAFAAVFRDYFAKLKLDRLIEGLLAERPLIQAHVGSCLVREAPRRKDESAELFVQETKSDTTPPTRTLVIQACPQSLNRKCGSAVDLEAFTLRMRRELLHVSDMLEPRFEYDRTAISGLPAQQNLVRDRYAVLWDMYVEGRLIREGRSDDANAARLERGFRRVFSGHVTQFGCDAFQKVIEAEQLTHPTLIAWARDPGGLFARGGERAACSVVSGGQRCPLCGFPTYDWYDFEEGADESVVEEIEKDHADWTTELGACRQCAEIFIAEVRGTRIQAGAPS